MVEGQREDLILPPHRNSIPGTCGSTSLRTSLTAPWFTAICPGSGPFWVVPDRLCLVCNRLSVSRCCVYVISDSVYLVLKSMFVSSNSYKMFLGSVFVFRDRISVSPDGVFLFPDSVYLSPARVFISPEVVCRSRDEGWIAPSPSSVPRIEQDRAHKGPDQFGIAIRLPGRLRSLPCSPLLTSPRRLKRSTKL